MKRQYGGRILCVASLALLVQSVWAVAPPGDATKHRPGRQLDDVVSLARKIDRHIEAGLKDRKVIPARPASDHEFVRRVYLDLAGRIPRVSEVRAFLADKRPDRRARLVEDLLKGSPYITHFANVWRATLLPNNNNQQVQFLANQIQDWARNNVRDDVPYDRMVRELIATPIASNVRGRFATPTGYNAGAAAFFQVNEMKPENIAAATSRLFLGVKIECAQCHDHPFAQWTRTQFWEYTAFFAGIKTTNPNAGVFSPATDDPKVREVAIPGTEKKVKARFLGGAVPAWKDDDQPRKVLAEWMTSRDNPYFSRAIANRLWEHFFGIGLVDPVDDFREDNPSSHPAMLDEMAKSLADHGFDLKFLIRAITATQAYQRSSVMTDPSQEDLRAFARMPLKGLSPEQIFDSLATAVGYRGDINAQRFAGGFNNNSPRGEILTRFANPVDRRTEHQTTILQALALMNGKFVSDATSMTRSETLAAVIDSPFMTTKEKLDTLFLAALARPMSGSEAGRFVPYVERGGPSGSAARALSDVFWVLLNSSEFILNH